MEAYTCAFTGHRPQSYSWRYDETDGGCLELKAVLAAQIAALAERGITDFFSGMALGADIWAAQAVLALRERRPAVRLRCLLPCLGQESRWTEEDQRRYRSILGQADAVTYVSREYTRGCMLKRNRCLADSAAVLLAVYNGRSRSGTGATVRYARSLGREIILIDPATRQIRREPPARLCPYSQNT